ELATGGTPHALHTPRMEDLLGDFSTAQMSGLARSQSASSEQSRPNLSDAVEPLRPLPEFLDEEENLRRLPAAIPFEHRDAQRRFRVITNVAELQRALDFPWEKWSIFLHPEQRQWVEGDYEGPARVSGTAGTGKTVVALHRTVHLA